MRDDRWAGLDFWKATLPILGPVYHATQASISLGASAWIGYVAIAAHSFRMQAFFAMAGLLAGTRLNRPDYLTARLRTLLVPALFLWLLSSLANPNRTSGPISGGLMHLWFLYSLAFLSVLIVVGERFGLNRWIARARQLSGVVTVTAVLVVLLQLFFPLPSHWDPTIWLPPMYAVFYSPYFVLGLLVARNATLRGSLLHGRAVIFTGPLLLASMLLVHHVWGLGNGSIDEHVGGLQGVLLALTALSMSIMVLAICVRPTRPAGRTLRWMGAAGYTVYVLHLPILRPIYGLTSGLDKETQFVVACILSAALPLAAFAVIQRSATLRFLFSGGELPRYIRTVAARFSASRYPVQPS